VNQNPDRVTPERVDELAAMLAELIRAAAAENRVDPAQPEPTLLVSLDEAARLLGISRSLLYTGPLANGGLESVWVEGRHLVPRAAIDVYVAGLRGEAS
jgi:hypothetical protein